MTMIFLPVANTFDYLCNNPTYIFLIEALYQSLRSRYTKSYLSVSYFLDDRIF